MPPKKKSKPGRIRYGKRSTQIIKNVPQVEPSAPTSPLKPEPPKTAVSQVESTELMKVLVVATISAIAFHRKIIPSTHIEHLPYDTYNPDASVKAFLGVHTENGEYSKNPEGEENILVARRGSHRHCNKLYNWIDGINDAVERKFLKGFELVFGIGVQEDLDILESYTFYFTYQSGLPTMQVNTQRTDGGENVSSLLSVAKEHVTRFVADLRDWMSKLVDLPEGLKVRMELKYNESAPDDYHAVNFKSYDVLRPRFSAAIQTSKELASIETGYHNLAVDCSTTMEITRGSSYTDLESDMEQHGADSSTDSESLEPTQRLVEEYRQQAAINLMARSRRQASHLRDSQTATQDTVQISNSMLNLHTQALRDLNSTAMDTDDDQPSMDKGESTSQQTRFGSLKTALPCECGNPHSDDKTTLCKCGRSIHACCYGYIDKFPPFQKCFSCSVGNDEAVVEDMKSLWFKRKVLYHLREKMNITDACGLRDLCDYIGQDTSDTLSLLENLADEGYLKKDATSSLTVCAYTYASTDQALMSRYFHKTQADEGSVFRSGKQLHISSVEKYGMQNLEGSTTASECESSINGLISTPNSRYDLQVSLAIVNEGLAPGTCKKRTSKPSSDNSPRKRAKGSASYFHTPAQSGRSQVPSTEREESV